MKKIIKYISLSIVLLIVSGCGTKDNSLDLLKSATEKLENANSYTFEINSKTEFVSNSEKETMEVIDILKFDGTNAHEKISAISDGENIELEQYIIVDGDEYHNYIYQNGSWNYKKNISLTPGQKVQSQYKIQLESILNSVTSSKKVKSDKDGYTKLEATIDKDKLAEVVNLFGDFSGANNEVTFEEELVFDVYLKDEYISVVEIDMSNLFKAMMELFGDESYDTIKMNVTYIMTNYDSTENVVLPSEVSEAVKTQYEEINKLNEN